MCELNNGTGRLLKDVKNPSRGLAKVGAARKRIWLLAEMKPGDKPSRAREAIWGCANERLVLELLKGAETDPREEGYEQVIGAVLLEGLVEKPAPLEMPTLFILRD